MSQTVDSKVVELSFNNQQFEQGCQQSMSTLDKLKQSLRFDGVSKGMDTINSAVKGVNMDSLGGAIETVRSKFSALDVMAMTVLSNITNRAVNAGRALVDSFTTKPIRDGFAEYELKMDSVQTIMAGTGASVETVNRYLNELNTYSDKTIYSFKDMTSSIGKFTNAGVELGTAVSAIQGIANEAARSGANANEASRAMYNFSQALSTGSVKLIDWKSIENANMATVEFKQQLIDTAVALGTVVKEGDAYKTTTANMQGKVSEAFTATSSFNDSLAHQWMTADVLTQTLSNYAQNVEEMTASEREAYHNKLMDIYKDEEKVAAIEKLGVASSKAATEVKTFSMMMDALKEAAGSGWAQTFELIFGNLEEAKALWTSVNNVVSGFIDSTSDARNNALQEWKDLGGRGKIIYGLSNIFKSLGAVLSSVKEAFSEVFPPITGKQLAKLSISFVQLTTRMRIGEETVKSIKDTFKGIFSAFSLFGDIVGAVLGQLTPIIPIIVSLASKILQVSGIIGSLVTKYVEWVKQNDLVSKKIESLKQTASDAFANIKERASEAYSSLSEFANAHLPMDKILGIRDAIVECIKSLTKYFKYVADGSFSIGNASKVVSILIGNMVNKIKEVLGISSEGKKTFNDMFSPFVGGVWGKVVSAFSFLKGAFSNIIGGLSSIKDTLWPSIEQMGGMLKEGLGNIVSGLMDSISGLGNQDLSTALGLAELAIIFSKLNPLFEEFKTAISNLFGSNNPLEKVTSLIDSFKGGFSSLVGGITDSLSGFQDKLKAESLRSLAISVAILAGSLFVLSTVPTDKLLNACAAMMLITYQLKGLMTALGATLKLSGADAKGFKSIGLGLALAAVGVLVLASAVKKMSDLSWEELARGLTGVLVTIGGLIIASRYINTQSKGMIKSAVAMVVLSFAVKSLAKGVAAFGDIPFETLINGIIGIGAVMLELSGTMLIMGEAKHVVKSAVSLILVAKALKGFVEVIGGLGGMNFDQLAQGIIAIGAVMLELSLAMMAIGESKHVISSALSMIIVAKALKSFVEVISNLGGMSLDELAQGIIGIGGALLTISLGLILMEGTLAGSAALLIASVALNALVPVIKSLGGMSTEQILKSLIVLAGAFAILGVAGLALGPLIPVILGLSAAMLLFSAAIALLGVGLIAVSIGFSSLGVSAAAGIAGVMLAITSFINGIAASASAIANAATLLIMAFLNSINAVVPALVNVGLNIVASILSGIANNIGPIVVAAVLIITNFINAIAQLLPVIIQAGFNLILAFINGIANGIRDNTDAVLGAVSNLVSAIVEFFLQALADIASTIPVIGDDISAGLEEARTKVNETLAPEEGQATGEKYGTAIGTGFSNTSEFLNTTVDDMLNGPVEKLKNSSSQNETYGKEFMHSYAKGVQEGGGEATTAVDNTAQKILSSVQSASTESSAAGEDLMKNWTASTEGMAPEVQNSMQNLISSATEGAVDSVDFSGITGDKGGDIVSGLASSVDGSSGEFNTSMINLASTGEEGFDSKLGIASPSKVMAQKGTYITAGLAQGVRQGQSSVNSAFRQMATLAITSMQQQIPRFRAAGVKAGSMFASGIRGSVSTISAAARSAVSGAASELSGGYDDAYRAGKNVGDGYADGIRSKVSAVRSAAKDLSRAGQTSTSKSDDAHSPSRVYRKFGNFVGDGYILGIKDRIRGVGNIAKEMSQGAIKATETPLRHIDAILGGAMDVDPVIKPVMDLSNIREGAGLIDSLMPNSSVGLSFAAAGAVRGANLRMTNDDVVAAVNELKSELKNMPKGDNITNVNGVTYDDGSNVASTVGSLIKAVRMERRI